MSDDDIIIEPQPETVSTVAKQRPAHLFKPGQSGNLNGRPKGSRNRHSENFLAAFANDFERFGVEVIQKVRGQSPEIYLKLAGDICPRETADKMQAGAGSLFHACESLGEIVQVLLAEFDVDQAIGLCDELKGELMRHASDQARPIG
jgi:hypothetical protein